MGANKLLYRHLMLLFYRKGRNAIQAANKMCAVYGEAAVAERSGNGLLGLKLGGDFKLDDHECPDSLSSLMNIGLK